MGGGGAEEAREEQDRTVNVNVNGTSMARVTRAMSSSWRSNILSASEALEVAKTCRRVAVLGIKTAEKRDQPAYHVPEYLQSCGVEVIPVPVYYPDVKVSHPNDLLDLIVSYRISAGLD